MPYTRSSKRKLTGFSSSPTSLTPDSRRRRIEVRNKSNHPPTPNLQVRTIKTDQTSTSGISDIPEASNIAQNLTLESKNIGAEHDDTKIGLRVKEEIGPSRFHQPKLSVEDDEVVMRKYYPAEMSNDRVEMYKSGKLPKPIDQLQQALTSTSAARSKICVKDAVVHWFRGDLRVSDNAALHLAGKLAQSNGASLIALFLVSPQDYEAHIKSPARVDFILRTLEVLRDDLDKLNIPLWVEVVENRKSTGHRVMQLMERWNASHIFGNMEYEVDELRRDSGIVKMALEKGIDFSVVHDSIIVPPGLILAKSTQQPFMVFSPWFKAWVTYLHGNPKYLDIFSPPKRNPATTRTRYKELFGCPIPPCPEGKELDPKEIDYIRSTWPPGENEAIGRLQKFLDEKIKAYKDRRDLPGGNGTSVLSVHFATGTLSSRTAVNKARDLLGNGTLNSGNKGITCWISEVGWREFYKMILIHFPWVCMSKPFKTEYSNIPWAYNEAHFEAWCAGRTGYPIVDAAMRQLATMKYMHNRTRMIVASFLAKDLCLDWRKGERFFMEHLIDGDFAANNGGWGWSSSSGCDPQPYFRIFNPLLQSEKFDPDGDYIRQWVPELKHVRGDAIHAPFERLDRKEWAKVEAMGYPKPIVKHAEVKIKALEMYKKGLGRDKP